MKDASCKDPVGYRMVLSRLLIAWMREKSTTNWLTCVGFIQTYRVFVFKASSVWKSLKSKPG